VKTVSNNVFFFRGGDGDYTTEEMRNRIPAGRISPETPEVMEMLEELNEVPSEVSSLNKNPHLDLVREECSRERYEEYISVLFQEYGKRGDKFNIQLFELNGSSLSFEELSEQAESLEGTDVAEEFSDLRDIPLALQRVNSNEEKNYIDFSFQTIESEEWINPTEDLPIVVYRGGEPVQEYSEPDYEIMAPATYRIEARVYIEDDLIAVSNFSSVKDGDQTDIVEIIGSLGRTQEGDNNE
jgi:hypothetical protein